jgi:hypothetical protein
VTEPLDEIRALVREVIRDVLPKNLPVTETVNLSTDEDLEAFVARLLDLDPQARDDLRAGRRRFRLAAPQLPPPSQYLPPPQYPLPPQSQQPSQFPRLQPATVADSRTAVNGSAARTRQPVRRIERGAVTEKVVREAARAGERLVLGPAAVLTPLARDRARTSGVEITKEDRFTKEDGER